MTYRAICQYLPDAAVHAVGRPGRGAWRVVACVRATTPSVAVSRPVLALTNLKPQLLVVTSHRHRQPNSWCSPRKIVAQWQAERQTERVEAGWDEFYRRTSRDDA